MRSKSREIESSLNDVVSKLSSAGGGDGIFDKLIGKDSSDKAGSALRRVALQVDALAVAAGAGVGALSAMGSGLFAMGAAAAQAAGGLIVIPATIGAVIQSALTLTFAFKGIGTALKLAGQQSAASSAGTTAAASAQQAAARGVESATQRLNKAREQAGRSATDSAAAVAAAQQAQARAAESSARAVAGAYASLDKVRKSNERSTQEAAKRVIEAQEGIGEAYERAAEASRAAAKRVADAQKGVRDAYERATESVSRAVKTVTSSEQGLARAQKDSERAQRAVNQARQDAVEDLEDLAFSLRGAVLGEKQAALDLADAKAQYADAQYLPADNRVRIDAQLALEQAQLSYDQAADRAKDTQAESDKAVQAGVEGSAKVVAAKEEEISAAEAVGDAEKSVADARAELVQAQRDGAESIADAEAKLADSREEAARTDRDNIRAIADAQSKLADAQAAQQETAADNAAKLIDAQQGVKDALDAQARSSADAAAAVAKAVENQKRSAADSAQGIKDAQQAVADAMARVSETAATATGAVDKYAEAMNKLSPEARAFVLYLQSIQGEFTKLNAAAGVELFPKLTSAIQEVIDSGFVDVLAEGFRITGSAIGDVALALSGLLADPFFQGNFATVMQQNADLTGTLGAAAVNLAGYLVALFAAADPLIARFGDFVLSLSETAAASLNTQAEIDHMSGKFDNAGDAAAQLFRIAENLFVGIGNLGRAATPAGQELLASFEGVTRKLADLDDAASQSTLGAYFDGVATNVQKIGDLFLGLGKTLGSLGGDSRIGDLAAQLQDGLLPIIDELVNNSLSQAPALVDGIIAIAQAFADLSETGALEQFVGVLGTFAKILSDALGDPVLGPIIQNFVLLEATLTALFLVRNFSGIGILVKGLQGIAPAALGATSAIAGLPAAIANGGLKKGLGSLFSVGEAGKGISSLRQTAGDSFTAIQLGAMSAKDGIVKFGTGIAESAAQMAGYARATAISLAATVKDTAVKVASAVATRAMAVASNVAAVASRALGIAIAFATGPIGLIIIGITALVAGFILLYKHSDAFRGAVDAVASAVSGFVSGAASAMLGALQSIGDAISTFLGDPIGTLKNFGTFLIEGLVAGLSGLGNAVTGAFSAVGAAVGAGIDAVLEFVGDHWPLILAIIAGPLGLLVKLIYDNWEAIRTTIANAVGAVAGFAVGLWDGFVGGVVVIYTAVSTAFTSVVDFLGGVVGTIVGFAAGLWDDYVLGVTIIYTKAVEIFNGVVSFLSGVVGSIVAFGTNLWDTYVLGVTIIYTKAVEIFNGVVAFIAGIVGTISEYGRTLFDAYILAATAVLTWVTDRFTDLINLAAGMKGRVTEALGDLFQAIRDKMDEAEQWVVDKFIELVTLNERLKDRITTALGELFQAIKDKVDSAKQWVVDKFIELVTLNERLKDRITTALGELFQAIKDKVDDAKTTVSNKFDDVITLVGGLKQRVTDKIGNIFEVFGDRARDLQNGLKSFFSSIIGDIGGIWDQLPDKLVSGTNAVIKFINDKMITPIQSVTGAFGLNITKIPEIEKRASGGIVGGERRRPGGFIRGPGGPRDDRIPVMASNGEFYVNARQTKRHRRLLEQINSGGPIVHRPDLGIGDGPAGYIGDAVDWAKGVVARGAEKTVVPIVEYVRDRVPRGDFPGDFTYGILDKLVGKVHEWGKARDSENSGEGAVYSGDIGTGPFVKPLGRYVISSPFGPRKRNFHKGIDLAVPIGNDVHSVTEGIVGLISQGTDSYGKRVDVQHNGFMTRYGHLNQTLLKVGTRVAAGTVIAKSGNTGGSTGPHVHFEVRRGGVGQFGKNGNLYNPAQFMASKGVRFDSGGLARGVGLLNKATVKPERVLSPRQTEAFERLVDALTANRAQYASLLKTRTALAAAPDDARLVKLNALAAENQLQYKQILQAQEDLKKKQERADALAAYQAREREAARAEAAASEAAAASSSQAPVVTATPATAPTTASTDCGPRVVQYINNYFPVAEATSVTTNRALQYAAALGDF